jgi:hypothetical protein
MESMFPATASDIDSVSRSSEIRVANRHRRQGQALTASRQCSNFLRLNVSDVCVPTFSISVHADSGVVSRKDLAVRILILTWLSMENVPALAKLALGLFGRSSSQWVKTGDIHLVSKTPQISIRFLPSSFFRPTSSHILFCHPISLCPLIKCINVCFRGYATACLIVEWRTRKSIPFSTSFWSLAETSGALSKVALDTQDKEADLIYAFSQVTAHHDLLCLLRC